MDTNWSDSYLQSVKSLEARIAELQSELKGLKFQSGGWHKVHKRILNLEYQVLCLWESLYYVRDFEKHGDKTNLQYYTEK